MYSAIKFFATFTLINFLVSCGGGSGGDSANNAQPLPAPEQEEVAASLSLAYEEIKTFGFTWVDEEWASHYKLFENRDGLSGFTQIGTNIAGGEQSYRHIVPLYSRTNASYILESCSLSNGPETCLQSDEIFVEGALLDAIGYFKASNAGELDKFGESVSLNGDGTMLAVGAVLEGSSATGINGSQNNDDEPEAGAVYIFELSGDSTWIQQAYIKASNSGRSDHFGHSLSFSSDGTTLAVGVPDEDSSSVGINGSQLVDVESSSGAVYIFTLEDAEWTQQAYIKSSNSMAEDEFGYSVSISEDGSILAVGAPGEANLTSGVNSPVNDYRSQNSGAVFIFARDEAGAWSQDSYLKASNSEGGDQFGYSLSLSSDGEWLAVAAPREESNAAGINGNQNNNSTPASGAAYVFSKDTGENWSQQAYIKANNPGQGDLFGESVSLSVDGRVLVIGSSSEDSSGSGVDPVQDDSAPSVGAAYVFKRDELNNWAQQAFLKASNAEANDLFGRSLDLSADGGTLVVGAIDEDSDARGINGDEINNDSRWSGAAYIFVENEDGSWSQSAFVKSSNTAGSDDFGIAVSLSDEGDVLAVGASGEDSSANVIGGDQTDNSSRTSGAVYLY